MIDIDKAIDEKVMHLLLDLEKEWQKENPDKKPKEFRGEASTALIRLAAASGSILGMTLSSGVAIFIEEYEITLKSMCADMIAGTLENMLLERIHEANKGKPEN